MWKPYTSLAFVHASSKRTKNLVILSQITHRFPILTPSFHTSCFTRSFLTTAHVHKKSNATLQPNSPDNDLTYKSFLEALHEKEVDTAVQYYQRLRDTPAFSKISHSSIIIRFFRLVQREVRQYPKQCADALHVIRESGLSLDTKAQKGEALIAYAKLGDFEGCKAFAETMLPTNETPSIFIYNQLIAAAGKTNLSLALDQYDTIKKSNLRPDQFTYNMLFKFCKAHRDLDTLKKLHAEMTRYDIHPNHITSSSLLDGYLKCADIQSATEMFDEMLSKKFFLESFVFNSVITGCVRAGLLEKARVYKDQMITRKMTPDLSTYQVYIRAHLNASNLDEAYESLNEMFVGNIVPDLNSINSVLSACLRKTSPVIAMEIYRQMLRYKLRPNTATFNYLFNILAKTPKDTKQILKIYDDMKSLKVPLDIATFNSLILAFIRMNRFDYVVAKHSELLLDGLQPNVYTYGMLIHAYSRHGDMDKATSLLEEMQQKEISPNITIYNTLMDGYGRDSRLDKAQELLTEMKEKVSPTPQTYNILMNAYLKNGESEKAFEIYRDMLSTGLAPNNYVYTTLMKCYASTGQHAEVVKLWELVRSGNDPTADLTPSASVLLYSFCQSIADQGDLTMLTAFWGSLKQQLRGRVTVDLYNTYVFLLCSIEKYNEAVNVITHEMNQHGIYPDIKTLQALLNRIDKAKKFRAKHLLLEHLKHGSPQHYNDILKRNPL